MAGDVTLGAAVRGNLLSLQATGRLVARTQGRLSSGLEVASPVDGATSRTPSPSPSSTSRIAGLGMLIPTSTSGHTGTNSNHWASVSATKRSRATERSEAAKPMSWDCALKAPKTGFATAPMGVDTRPRLKTFAAVAGSLPVPWSP